MTSSKLEIKWMRAEEIARNHNYVKPLLFKEGPTRFDINQGKLGDCWFLATLANLPAYPKVFNKVLDKSQSFENNPGKYQINLFQFVSITFIIIFFDAQESSVSSSGSMVNGLKLSLMTTFPPSMANCCS